MGRGFPVRSILHKHDDWVSDSFWMAHCSVPFFGLLHSQLGARNGAYDLAELATAGAVWKCESGVGGFVDRLHSARLQPAELVEQAPAQLVDIDDPNEVMGSWEPWYFDHPAGSGLVLFDGRIAHTTTLTLDGVGEPVTDWHLTDELHPDGHWALVGVRDHLPRFALMAMRRDPRSV